MSARTTETCGLVALSFAIHIRGCWMTGKFGHGLAYVISIGLGSLIAEVPRNFYKRG